jgi:uncharacterized protein (DUF2252 family)
MSFVKANACYEAWLKTQCPVVEKDLARKHSKMADCEFSFLRATFFRWAGTIEKHCAFVKDCPSIPAIGDVHVENFGTWRDGQGRLVWGVNDFDEGAVIPFANDLIRLAASARLAPGSTLSNRDVALAILEGYGKALKHPRPTLLDEEAIWMRRFVACSDAARAKFWQDIDKAADAEPPRGVVMSLTHDLPKDAKIERFARRTKGGGSLGRPRYIAIATWRGGRIVREAKALVPSAWYWARDTQLSHTHLMELATGPHRAPDPHLHVRDGYIIRQIAPDARKIDLAEIADATLTVKLLEAMGFDLGAIHAADAAQASRIKAHLKKMDDDWLHQAAKDVTAAVRKDFEEWKKHCA